MARQVVRLIVMSFFVLPSPARAEDVAFTVSVRLARPPTASVLRPGQVLEPGDRLAFVVDVKRPAYLYILQFINPLEEEVIYPDDAAHPTLVSGQVRVPADPEWLPVENDQGAQYVYLLTSSTPLSATQRRKALVEELKQEIHYSAANTVLAPDALRWLGRQPKGRKGFDAKAGPFGRAVYLLPYVVKPRPAP